MPTASSIIAVLLTVYNRREKTLACLEKLWHEDEKLKSDGGYSLSVYLVDDGSTDGTSEAVMERFPGVHLIKGEGNLFWNQGMRLAWDEAAKEDPDFYLWVNDDTIVNEGAIATLTETSAFLRHRAIVVGTSTGADGQLSYGGRTKSNKVITPDPVLPLPCFTFNGNLVLVPRWAWQKLGNLEARYHHGFGDYDYGVRAAKSGVTCVVAPGISASCDRNPGVEKWRDANYPLKERYRFLKGPKGRPPSEQFLYDRRMSGIFYAIGHFIMINLKVIFPRRGR